MDIINIMQSAVLTSTPSFAASDNAALLAQIKALRDSLKNQRNRARNLWDSCSPAAAEDAGESRAALGRFTEKLLKGESDAVYS